VSAVGKPNRICLLGAGFSRNWGGWLAKDVNEYLLTCREVQQNGALKDALIRFKDSGGFEAAAADLQARYVQTRSAPDLLAVEQLQSAISEMFAAMDAGFQKRPFEFQQPVYREYTVALFLTRFDAIFTLNQDYLLERHYLTDNVMLLSDGRWPNGWQIPGMLRVVDSGRSPLDSKPQNWEPDASRLRIEKHSQPYFKLHGSSNWIRNDGGRLLILGSEKLQQVRGQETLRWYMEQFERYLSQPTKLMILGYGYRDLHINQLLMDAARRGALSTFVVDPNGLNAFDQNNLTRRPGNIYCRSDLDALLAPTLVGGSSRNLSETFNQDFGEHAKLMTFFRD
jgi:hypothetical protein